MTRRRQSIFLTPLRFNFTSIVIPTASSSRSHQFSRSVWRWDGCAGAYDDNFEWYDDSCMCVPVSSSASSHFGAVVLIFWGKKGNFICFLLYICTMKRIVGELWVNLLFYSHILWLEFPLVGFWFFLAVNSFRYYICAFLTFRYTVTETIYIMISTPPQSILRYSSWGGTKVKGRFWENGGILHSIALILSNWDGFWSFSC